MSVTHVLLAVTTLIAVVALAVALVAVGRLRRLSAAPAPGAPSCEIVPAHGAVVPSADDARSVARRPDVVAVAHDIASGSPAHRIVEGRVIVPPTAQQVRSAVLGRPLVRLNVVVVGMAHALRPESRDRLRGLMRREFRARKRQRRQAARRAAQRHVPVGRRELES